MVTTSQQPIPTQQLDPEAVNLAKAIRQTETGGDFNAKGGSGEWGAYQFTKPTFDQFNQEFGTNYQFGSATPEQQNELAYKQVKAWKDAGYNVGQIASMWNAGSSRPNAYLEGNVGINKYGVKYDTGAYAKSVATAYQTLKQGGQVGIDPNNPSSTEGTQKTHNPYGATFATNDATGNTGNPLLDIGQGVATDVAKGIGNIPSSALNLVKNIGGMALHPIQTVENLGNTAMGGVEAGLRALTGKSVDDARTQQFNTVLQGLKDRYGSLDAIRKTAIEDPVGLALDVATITEGAGSALESAGKLGQASELADVGEQIGKAGEAMNPVQQATQAVGGGIERAGNKLAGVQNEMELKNLRMTPVQSVKYAPKVPDVLDFVKENGLNVGNSGERYAKSVDIVNSYENTLQNFLQQGDAKDIVVPTDTLKARLENLKIKYQASDVADLQQAANQVDSAIQRLNAYGDEVPLSRLNNLKRSVFDSAYNEAGNKVLNWVEHDIGGVYKGAIEDSTDGLKINGKSIKDFNKDYSTALTTKQLLKIAASRPEIDFLGRGTGRLAATFLAEQMGGIPGSVAAYIAEPKIAQWLGGTAARSRYGRLAAGAGGLIAKTGKAVKSVAPIAGKAAIAGNLAGKLKPPTSALGR